MNPILITGTIIVTFALLFYSISVITEQRKKTLTSFVLTTRTIGVVLDVTATAFMIAGSRKIPFTFHGLLGYSALAGMLVDTVLAWRFAKSQKQQAVSPGLKLCGYLSMSFAKIARAVSRTSCNG